MCIMRILSDIRVKTNIPRESSVFKLVFSSTGFLNDRHFLITSDAFRLAGVKRHLYPKNLARLLLAAQ